MVMTRGQSHYQAEPAAAADGGVQGGMVKNALGGLVPAGSIHMLLTSNGNAYQNYQTRILLGTLDLIRGMPGGERHVGITRVLHRTKPDALMSVVETFHATPLQPQCDGWCEYPVSDRANAVRQFFDAAAKRPEMIKVPPGVGWGGLFVGEDARDTGAWAILFRSAVRGWAAPPPNAQPHSPAAALRKLGVSRDGRLAPTLGAAGPCTRSLAPPSHPCTHVTSLAGRVAVHDRVGLRVHEAAGPAPAAAARPARLGIPVWLHQPHLTQGTATAWGTPGPVSGSAPWVHDPGTTDAGPPGHGRRREGRGACARRRPTTPPSSLCRMRWNSCCLG